MTPCRYPGCTKPPRIRVAEDEWYCRPDAAKEAWTLARQFVMDRDNRTCQRYGGPGDDVHHLVTRGAAPWLKYDPDNLLALSRDAHAEAHLYPATFVAWLGEKWPGRWQRLWERNVQAERKGASVDLAAVIAGFRNPELTAQERDNYESGEWLG